MWQGWVQVTRCSWLRQGGGRGHAAAPPRIASSTAPPTQTTAPSTHQQWPSDLLHRHVDMIAPWSPSWSRSRRRAAASRGAASAGHWRPAAAAKALPPRPPPPRRWAAMGWWRIPCCRWPRPPHAAGHEAAERPEEWFRGLRALAPPLTRPATPPWGPPRRQARCRPAAHPHLIVAAVDEQEGVVHGRGQRHVQRQLPGLALGPARPS